MPSISIIPLRPKHKLFYITNLCQIIVDYCQYEQALKLYKWLHCLRPERPILKLSEVFFSLIKYSSGEQSKKYFNQLASKLKSRDMFYIKCEGYQVDTPKELISDTGLLHYLFDGKEHIRRLPPITVFDETLTSTTFPDIFSVVNKIAWQCPQCLEYRVIKKIINSNRHVFKLYSLNASRTPSGKSFATFIDHPLYLCDCVLMAKYPNNTKFINTCFGSEDFLGLATANHYALLSPPVTD